MDKESKRHSSNELQTDDSSSAQESEPQKVRRTLKNEDSSYDSDFEPSEVTDSPSCSEGQHEDVCRTVSDTLGREFAEYVTVKTDVSHSSDESVITTTTVVDGVTTTIHHFPPPSRGYMVASSANQTTSSFTSKTPLTSTISLTAPIPQEGRPVLHGKSSVPLGVVPRAPSAQSALYQQQLDYGIKRGYSESLVQLALKKLGSTPSNNQLLDELIKLEAGVPKCEYLPVATPVTETKEPVDVSSQLKPVIIDGSNVAMSHGDQITFSCVGLKLCVEWFQARGHKEITVFVPLYRKENSRWDNKISHQEILGELEEQKVLVFTPSRTTHTTGRRIVPYDDRYILKEAIHCGGIVVSNDNFRDLANENADFKRVVEKDILIYSWVNGRFVPPDDPLGRNGPTLDSFLKKPKKNPACKEMKPCPYGPKCTYGNKCKYQHPEKGSLPVKSVTEKLQEQRENFYRGKGRDTSPGECLQAKLSLPGGSLSAESQPLKKPLSRTQSFSVGGNTQMYPNAPPMHESRQGFDPQYPPYPNQHMFLSPQNSCEQQRYPSYPMYPPPLQQRHLSQGHIPWRSPRPNYSPLKETKDSSEHLDNNPHPILERQLTLNPMHDQRLDKMSTVAQKSGMHYHSQQNVHYHQMHHLQQPYDNLEGNPMCNIPGFTYRHPERQHMQPQPPHSTHNPHNPHSGGSVAHPHVTRFSSAPDPVWGGASGSASSFQVGGGDFPPISRLNSTSDPHLNAHSEEQAAPTGAPRFPGQTGNEEERSRLYYHLTNLFAESEVLAALAKHPNETDAKKLCQSILLSSSESNTSAPHADSRLSKYLNLSSQHSPGGES